MPKLILRLWILICLASVAWGPSFAMGQFSFLENTMTEKASPDFTSKTAKGPELNFSKFRNGQSAIIFFWATWCPHCREQLKELNAKAGEIEKKGIKVILVDVGETDKEVRAYVDKYKIAFEVFLDEDNTVADKYSIIGVPTLFFINKKGVIKDTEHYLPDHFEEILKKE